MDRDTFANRKTSPQIEGWKASSFEGRNLVIFFVLVLGLNWSKAILHFFGIIPSGASIPGTLLDFIAGWGPTLAAVALTALTLGKPGLIALWNRFWNRDLDLKWLAVAVLFVPALWLAANLLSLIAGGENYRLFDQPGLFFSAFLSSILPVLGEEFGWRGYVLPRFQVRWNALVSSLILGVLWAAWHKNFFTQLLLNPITGNPVDPGIWEWIIWIIIMAVFTTWVFNNTNGSIMSAVIFHIMMNAGAVIFWCCTVSWYWPGVLGAAALLIVILFGAKTLVRHPHHAIAAPRAVSG